MSSAGWKKQGNEKYYGKLQAYCNESKGAQGINS